MFSRFRAMKKIGDENSSTPKGFGLLKAEIHLRMAAHVSAPRLRVIAEDNAWPLEIDFIALPRRIRAMKDEITGYVENDIVLQHASMWELFIDTLKLSSISLVRFGRLSAIMKFNLLRTSTHAG